MALPRAGVELIAEGLSQFLSGMGKADDAVDTFGKSGSSAGKSFSSGFGDVVTGAMRQIGALGVEALLKAGKAVEQFVGDSIKKAGDFQANMLEFQSVAGKEVDTKGLEKFHDLFLQLGKELPVSTSEVQQAAIEMVKGGIDPATIAAGGLRQNIQFAAAAMGGDLVKAAEISSKILGGWAGVNATATEKADFLTHATDLLAKAANASSTDVEGLSLGIFNSQGIARTAGVSFDDLTTTLAELAPRFASSSEAGTSLKNLIARLQPTTAPAIAAMQGLGLITEDGKNKFYDASGAFVGFQQASQILQDSLIGLTKQQQAAVLQTVFGNDAMSAAAALAELGAHGYTDMATALDQANGVQAAAALKQQGFNTALDNAKGSVEALQITLGEKLLPILTDLLNNSIAPAINAFTDWAGAILSAKDPMRELVKQIDILIPGFQDIVSIGETVIGAVSGLVASFQSGGDASKRLGGVVDDLGGVFQLFQKVVTDVMGGYMAIAQAVLPIIQKLWLDHGAEISAFVKQTYDQVIAIIRTALQLYDAIVPPILAQIAKTISEHGQQIETILSGAWQIISGIITGALALIQGIVKTALDVLRGDWSGAWNDIQTMSATFVQSIIKVVTGLFEVVAGLFDTSLAKIGQLWQHNWDMMVEIAGKIVGRMVEVGANIVAGIQQGISDAWGSLTHWLEQKLEDLWNAGLKKIGAASPATEWMPVGEFSVLGIMEGFASKWPDLMDQVAALSSDLVRAAGDIADRVQSAIADAFGATASIDRQAAKNLDSLSKITDDFQRGYAEQALRQAQQQAEQFADPAEGAKYFKMQSDQIFELAKLKEQYANAESDADKARIAAQMNLILKAQQAEQSAFDANAQTTKNPYQDLIDQIQKLMATPNLPGLLENDAVRVLANLLTQLTGMATRAGGGPLTAGHPYLVGEHGPELFMPRSSGMIAPPASPGQIMQRGNTSYSNSTTLNMPVYTNMTPAAIGSSLAIAGASLP